MTTLVQIPQLSKLKACRSGTVLGLMITYVVSVMVNNRARDLPLQKYLWHPLMYVGKETRLT